MFKDTFNFKAIIYAAMMVAAMWVGFFLQHLGWFEGCSGAIIPLNPSGLKGIFF